MAIPRACEAQRDCGNGSRDVTAACRGCGGVSGADRAPCPTCGDSRRTHHPELLDLAIAHIDCDAFYASIEKRDEPSLAAKPVIVGGGQRGVVATACYLARAFGVRSAMPMFKAKAACPHAVIIKPNMAKYVTESHKIRAMMDALTPLVEPLSIDEAFLDLSGTQRLHAAAPAQALIRLQNSIEERLQLSVSVGLSYNKFLAKLASDLDKPRGFSVIGRSDAIGILAPLPVSRLPGVGPKFTDALVRAGFRTIADLQRADPKDLARRFGETGLVLAQRAQGLDNRRVEPDAARKSVSSETTFMTDISDKTLLEDHLWALAHRTADRAKADGVAGRVVVLKLKDSRFHTTTRRLTLHAPTQLASVLFRHAQHLLAGALDGSAYRLIGIGLSDLCDPSDADRGDLIDAKAPRDAAAERAADMARARFGASAVMRGRDLRLKQDRIALDDQPFGQYEKPDDDR